MSSPADADPLVRIAAALERIASALEGPVADYHGNTTLDRITDALEEFSLTIEHPPQERPSFVRTGRADE